MELITFILCAYGLTQILVYSDIPLLQRLRPKKDSFGGYGKVFHCPMCIGFHVGWLLMLLSPFTELFNFDVTVANFFLLGWLSSGTALKQIIKEEVEGLLSELPEQPGQGDDDPQVVSAIMKKVQSQLASQLQQIDDFGEVIAFINGLLEIIESLNVQDFTPSEKVRTYLAMATSFRDRSKDVQKAGAQAQAVPQAGV